MEIFIKFERDVVYVHIWYFLIWNDHVLLMKRRHLEWRIKIVVLLKTCPGLIRKRYTEVQVCFQLKSWSKLVNVVQELQEI